MEEFFEAPIFRSGSAEVAPYLQTLEHSEISLPIVRKAIEQNKLLLIHSTPFEAASAVFRDLADHYGIRDSYDLQMQYVVHLMKDRAAIADVAVTVNERGPFQMIQSHSEGDSTSPLDLFGLYCVRNAASGGENILSLINQAADHSRLRAKEKAIVGSGLSAQQVAELRRDHLDARAVLKDCSSICRVLTQTAAGKVVVRPVPLERSRSAVTGENLVTYWDNVTVHDHAFHRHQYALLRHLGILHDVAGSSYTDYMHVEEDSNWAPADSDSGDLGQTSQLFNCHVLHKMQAGDFLVFHNRAWTHAVNNWPPDQVRELRAMYA